MSNDIAECGCEGHAENFLNCQYPFVKARLDRFHGPRCLQEQNCPDYDGEHPYHFNCVVRAWDRFQKEKLEPVEAKLKDLKWENGIQAELIEKLTEDNRQLLIKLHGANQVRMKGVEKAELDRRSLLGELRALRDDLDLATGEAILLREELEKLRSL